MKHFLVSWPGVVRVIRCVAHDLPELLRYLKYGSGNKHL